MKYRVTQMHKRNEHGDVLGCDVIVEVSGGQMRRLSGKISHGGSYDFELRGEGDLCVTMDQGTFFSIEPVK